MEKIKIEQENTFDPEKFYEKDAIDGLKEAKEIEDIIYPTEKYFDVKDKEIEEDEDGILFNELKSYFQSPIIKDNFKNHSERREWRNKFQHKDIKAYELYERNRVRLNKMTIVLGICELIKNNLPKGIESEFEDVFKEIQELKEDYRNVPFEKKEELANKVQDLAYRVYHEMDSI